LRGNLWQKAAALFQDPPPDLAFEVCEAGISMARTANPSDVRFQELSPGTIAASPLHDNVVMMDDFSGAISALLAGANNRRYRTAAVILPDHSARISVLEFDSFPDKYEDQEALVRFRLKKSVPFDIESAAVRFFRQPNADIKKQEVVVAVSPLEVIARYEAPFRARGIQPGFLTVSPLAVLDLVTDQGISTIAKLNGLVLTIMVTQQANLKLIRTLELNSQSIDEIASDLYPTFVYIEDRFNAQSSRLLLCGFGVLEAQAITQFHAELGIEVDAVRSPVAALNDRNAGLLGYLRGVKAA
jgi:type IV pilus assembly protein PilM